MELEFNRKEKAVGVFIIIVMTLLIMSIISIGRGKDWFKSYVHYYTIFNEGYNLAVNAEVKLFKANIGKVTGITPIENKVRVELAILEAYATRIRQDSEAMVESPTFIGSEYVSIKPGSPKSLQIQEGEKIRSREKKSIAALLSEFEVEKTAKMLMAAIQDFATMTRDLRDPDGPLYALLTRAENTLTHLEQITGDLQQGRGIAGQVLKSRALAAKLNTELEKIDAILDQIYIASAKAPATMDSVQANLATLQKVGDGVVDNVGSVKQILAGIEQSLIIAKQILANTELGSRDIPEMTRASKQGIMEIRRGVEQIDRVVKSMQQNVFIRSNLPPAPQAQTEDANLRP